MTKWQLAIGMSTCLGRCTECGVEIGRGPCNDKSIARHLLAKASAQVRPQQLVANAGYGAECVHELCRERWRVEAVGYRGVWSEWSSAITPLEGVVNDPCFEVAASGRNGQVRGRWRSR
jgi:hypothetical protein